MPKFLEGAVDSYNAAGRPGFGAMIYARRLGSVPTSGVKLGTMLGGIRDIRGPNPMTNPIVASHHRLTGGAVQVFPGLRDYGTLDFDCNFYPDQLKWQQDAGDFIRSLTGSPIVQDPVFGDNTPMLDLAMVFPQTSKAIWFAQGFLMSAGPYMTGQMEGVMQTTFSFKISGKAYLVMPVREGTFGNVPGNLDAVTSATSPGSPLKASQDYVARVILKDKYEVFSAPLRVAAGETTTWKITRTTPTPARTGADTFGATEVNDFRAEVGTGDQMRVMVYEYPFV